MDKRKQKMTNEIKKMKTYNVAKLQQIADKYDSSLIAVSFIYHAVQY